MRLRSSQGNLDWAPRELETVGVFEMKTWPKTARERRQGQRIQEMGCTEQPESHILISQMKKREQEREGLVQIHMLE